MKQRTKELLIAFGASIAINLVLLWLYVTYVMPYINEAAKGIANMMIGK